MNKLSEALPLSLINCECLNQTTSSSIDLYSKNKQEHALFVSRFGEIYKQI